MQWRPATADTIDPGLPVRFGPIPGLTPPALEALARGGGMAELFTLYGTWPSGRVVLAGPPGSGKGSAAVLLLLEALRHRAALEPSDAAKVPVPVLLTLSGWTPAATPFEQWFAERLAALHLSGPSRVQQAADLVRSGRVAALLDGLDEMPANHRPVALEALGAAPVRVVVFTRIPEHAEASRRHRLLEAFVAELVPLEPETVVGYLERAFPGLQHHVRRHPVQQAGRRIADDRADRRR